MVVMMLSGFRLAGGLGRGFGFERTRGLGLALGPSQFAMPAFRAFRAGSAWFSVRLRLSPGGQAIAKLSFPLEGRFLFSGVLL
ncbi:hypothetical protein [Bosea thiooxidans]